MRVNDKVVIVTGAASGLGAAHAALLAREGAIVILTDVDRVRGEATAAAIPNSRFVRQDVREEAGWAALIANVMAAHGRLDGLVNNAGVCEYGTIEDASLDQYRKLNAVMSEGTFLGCKFAVAAMKQGGGGSIVNTASIAATRGFAPVAAYSAAKGAIMALTRSVAVHCIEQGYAIRCNAIVPGAHDTPMTRAAMIDGPAGESGFDPIRLGLQGEPEDVANLVLFLLSDESRRITGTSVVIDHGQTAK